MIKHLFKSRLAYAHVLLLSIYFTALPLFAEWRYDDFPTRRCEDFLSPIKPRTEAQIPELKFFALNTAGMVRDAGAFDHTETPGQMRPRQEADPRRPLTPQRKENFKLNEQLRIIRENDPDIAILTEITGMEDLDEGISHDLKKIYRPYVFQSNDPRQITIVFLVKRDLPWSVKPISHHLETWDDPISGRTGPLFTRNLPILEFYRNENGQPQAKPLFVAIGNHAKSQRDRPDDARSEIWRTAQYSRATEIVREYLNQNNMVIFAGDFNVNLDDETTTRELGDLSQLLAGGLAPHLSQENRWTHSYHPRRGDTVYSRMDEIMINPELLPEILRADVIPYQDSQGRPLGRPRTFDERERQPSDHRPVILILRTNLIFSR